MLASDTMVLPTGHSGRLVDSGILRHACARLTVEKLRFVKRDMNSKSPQNSCICLIPTKLPAFRSKAFSRPSNLSMVSENGSIFGFSPDRSNCAPRAISFLEGG